MVVKGRYTVELVEATTKKPFQEHHHEDKHYAEVEPGEDYLIKVHVSKGDAAAFVPIVTEVFVDGVLSVETQFLDDKLEYEGHFESNGTTWTTHPLRFHRLEPTVSTNDSDIPEESSAVALGSILVQFFALGGKQAKNDLPDSKAPSGGVGKMVCSGKGSDSQHDTGTVSSAFEAGDLLDTITVHYATVPGLIFVGILPQPPPWEGARLNAPFKGPIDPKLASIEPVVTTTDAVVAPDGTQLKDSIRIELFDLTYLSDDDDDDIDDGCDDSKKSDMNGRKRSTEDNEGGLVEEGESEKSNNSGDREGKPKSDEDVKPQMGMKLKEIASGSIARSSSDCDKRVDLYFIDEYDGMPYSLFIAFYKRKSVLEGIATDFEDTWKDSILGRIKLWEREIAELNSRS